MGYVINKTPFCLQDTNGLDYLQKKGIESVRYIMHGNNKHIVLMRRTAYGKVCSFLYSYKTILKEVAGCQVDRKQSG